MHAIGPLGCQHVLDPTSLVGQPDPAAKPSDHLVLLTARCKRCGRIGKMRVDAYDFEFGKPKCEDN